ncbi:hypothetical protein BGZ83_008460 [Gryganskiella cystojenkinii]|nr:hypothetical protein BGZ83_008460 [Gryganskiella cystojenkinii]
MPLLLKAVPLHQGWHGVHYWKTPKMQDLPVELEYIPYLEFEERFVQLNEIARRRYPTYWPNIAFSLVFIAITAAATIGIIHAGTNLAIMGQGACFVLPVIVIVWYKIRKETKAIARRKVKDNAGGHMSAIQQQHET